ncbi:hypothetical protein LIER_23941 [Lithospermum erythrorhizon]|uniref:Uncharacterized protein n=1 Tax=Lithospermum erythrorhizon TaxID=34254 RepID=A0AAV3QZH6_LITER
MKGCLPSSLKNEVPHQQWSRGYLRGSEEGKSMLPIINTIRHLLEDTPPPRQKRVREAHTNVMKVQSTFEDNDPNDKESAKHGEPHGELELVPFREGHKSKIFRIGTKLSPPHRMEFIHLIQEFGEVFMWGPEDMPGVDADLAIHRLHSDPSFSLVKQKKRNFSDEKNLAIQKEVEELVHSNAIR